MVEEEGGEEDLADAGGRHGHVSLWSAVCTLAARFCSVSALHTRAPSSLHFFLFSLSYSLGLKESTFKSTPTQTHSEYI